MQLQVVTSIVGVFASTVVLTLASQAHATPRACAQLFDIASPVQAYTPKAPTRPALPVTSAKFRSGILSRFRSALQGLREARLEEQGEFIERVFMSGQRPGPSAESIKQLGRLIEVDRRSTREVENLKQTVKAVLVEDPYIGYLLKHPKFPATRESIADFWIDFVLGGDRFGDMTLPPVLVVIYTTLIQDKTLPTEEVANAAKLLSMYKAEEIITHVIVPSLIHETDLASREAWALAPTSVAASMQLRRILDGVIAQHGAWFPKKSYDIAVALEEKQDKSLGVLDDIAYLTMNGHEMSEGSYNLRKPGLRILREKLQLPEDFNIDHIYPLMQHIHQQVRDNQVNYENFLIRHNNVKSMTAIRIRELRYITELDAASEEVSEMVKLVVRMRTEMSEHLGFMY